MMTKTQFVKRMSLISNFHSEQQTLSALVGKITDGYNVVTIGNDLVSEMISMIEEDIGYKEILDWWLYENVEKVIYYKNEVISVKTLDELYHYMVLHSNDGEQKLLTNNCEE